jgi:hypothetical protein
VEITIKEKAMKNESVIREVKYVCSKCGVEDTVKLYNGEGTPMGINCWNCKAGYGMQLPQMLQVKTGMFPVPQAN